MPENEPFQHNVFISWSGSRSKHVAEGLREWLPMVLHVAKPWMSKSDIDKGSRGLLELSKALEQIKVGIICLTPENLSANWILFEAGALSKTLDRGTRVCTYLLGGLRPENVERPLGEFQATVAEKEDTRKLIQDIGKTLDSPVAGQTLNEVFEALWPRLEEKLSSMPRQQSSGPPKRPLEDMVVEILELTRMSSRENDIRWSLLTDMLSTRDVEPRSRVTDEWTKTAPSGRLVTYSKGTTPDRRWVYSVTLWGRPDIKTSETKRRLSRKQVEAYFADHVATG